MAISLKVNGNPGTEGFLIAPSGGKEYSMPVALKSTDNTTVNATLVIVAPAGVTVTLSSTSVTIGPTGTSVKITAKTPSKTAGDIKLQVKVGASVKASCTLTSIKNTRIRFGGRFQARFPTDGDFFNNPRGTTAGWTWALEGEPDFVPGGNTVPTQPGMAVGRVVRFQSAVAPRPHVAPIGVKVMAVEGDVGTRTVTFKAGDPIIGEVVNLGPNTYLASNQPIPPGPQPFEQYGPGFEPMENFEIHIGTKFSGKPAALNDRPKANGFFQLTTQERTRYGVVLLNQFASQRKQVLLTDYHNLSPAARTGTAAGRNLATRIGHLGGSAPDTIPATQATLLGGWTGKETYNGTVNSAIQITPGSSRVMSYFSAFQSFLFSGTLLNFHSDELCGQVDGTLQPQTPLLLRQIEN
ncbi:MAG TPA: hypothetical protein VGO73_07955 [Pyrinomonadaceae bacterium]|jgi:hypothetical protein|nr:hypothetical protein [Pyrinomonadaceae bacterium]